MSFDADADAEWLLDLNIETHCVLCRSCLIDNDTGVLADEQLRQGIGLFNDGEFFRCHEVLEEAWRLERGLRRQFLQAVIHVAVGFYHSQRGNTEGAVRQLRKGLEKLSAYAPSCEGMDTAQLYRDALVATEAIEAGIRLSTYPQIHASSDMSSYLLGHPRPQ